MVKKDETYQLTFKGFMYKYLPGDIQLNGFIDDLELYMRRNNYNAIVLDNRTFSFVKVEKED